MAYLSEASNLVKPITATSAIEDFDAVLSRLEAAAVRAGSCADKINGGQLQPVSNSKEMVAASCLIAQIQQRRERLMRVVDVIDAEITRIENGL